MTTTQTDIFDDRITAHYRSRQEREHQAKEALSGLDAAVWQIELELINTKKELLGRARWMADKMARLIQGLETEPDRNVYSSDAAASLHADVERLAAQAESLQKALEAARAAAPRDDN